MQQHQYEAIIKCINFGSPATANELIAAFNNIVKTANDYIAAQQAANAVKDETKDNKKK
jgi:uncharacterized protein YPO0396